MNALPAAPGVGTTVRAPVFPHDTHYRKPVEVLGKVIHVGPYTLTLKTAGGYRTVIAGEAVRL